MINPLKMARIRFIDKPKNSYPLSEAKRLYDLGKVSYEQYSKSVTSSESRATVRELERQYNLGKISADEFVKKIYE